MINKQTTIIRNKKTIDKIDAHLLNFDSGQLHFLYTTFISQFYLINIIYQSFFKSRTKTKG